MGGLSGGQAATLSAPATTGLIAANAGNANVGGSSALVGTAVLAPTTPTGTAATAGVLSSGTTTAVTVAPARSLLKGGR